MRPILAALALAALVSLFAGTERAAAAETPTVASTTSLSTPYTNGGSQSYPPSSATASSPQSPSVLYRIGSGALRLVKLPFRAGSRLAAYIRGGSRHPQVLHTKSSKRR